MIKHVAGQTYLTDVRSMFVKSRVCKFHRSMKPGSRPEVELTPMMQELTVSAVFEYDLVERHSGLIFKIEQNSFTLAELQDLMLIGKRTYTLAGRPMAITNVEVGSGRITVWFEQSGCPLELFEGSIV